MKKTLSLFSWLAILFLVGTMLGGCTLFKKSGQQATANPESNVEIDQSLETNEESDETEPIIDQLVSEEKATDESLGIEIDNLDEEFETLKTTGFESQNLSDTELGL